MGTEPQKQQSRKPQQKSSDTNFLQQLIGWGSKFRGFLGIVAFMLVIFLALITYLFSRGAFDQVLNGFGKLTSEQFLTVVYLVLGLPFILIVLLIILSFRSTRPHVERGDIVIFVQVSDSETKKRLAGAEINISFHGTRTQTTDTKGEAVFTFPAIYKGETCTVEIFKAGYQSESFSEKLGKRTDLHRSLTPEVKQQSSTEEGSGWDNSLSNLTYVLADLYPFKEDSVPVVRSAGLNSSTIEFSNKAINNWSAILSEAKRGNKVPDIIRAALRDYPVNEFLLSAQRGTLTTVKPILDDTISWKSRDLTETVEKSTRKQSSLLPLVWLEVGLQRSRSVARIKRTHMYATGFLIRNNWFLTSHHIIRTKDEAKATTIQFNYEVDATGSLSEPMNFELDPDVGFLTSSEHEWTVVKVKGDANREWGFLELKPVEINLNSRANIIQHPGGGAKQITFSDNVITYVDSTLVQYLSETFPGSSGSPVFDDQWRLIAVHHKSGVLTEPDTKKQAYRKEGININCILKDLEQLGGL